MYLGRLLDDMTLSVSNMHKHIATYIRIYTYIARDRRKKARRKVLGVYMMTRESEREKETGWWW